MIPALAKFITGGFEALLAIPFIGGSIVVFTGYGALGTAFILHLVALAIMFVYRRSKAPNIFGLVTSLLAWIPVVGWIMHVIAAIWLIVDGVSDSKRG
ncbi:hypothetical protein [Salibacterium halotolerans]|uniref:Superinfection immunity protein n=1 Tax=Salibacterium halotolerans TaxID=1884432 RepID=A0A1I5L0A1_9BACI|nr:hypothetical protein [Salibacterium halotolerans]SFO90583.1 hypothetical protein SAMN05518683_10148 [Salibacterium halotolerans]